MTTATLFTFVVLLGLVSVFFFVSTGRFGISVSSTPAKRPAARRSNARPSNASPKAPAAAQAKAAVKPAGTFPPKNSTPAAELEPLAWDNPAPLKGPLTLRREPGAKEAGTERIRERYLAARFPGVLKSASDLADSAHIVKSARLLFEDGHAARAGELLDLASEAHPEFDSTWLANLEIAFLDHNAERYTRLAHAFHGAHPDSPDWPEVMRLGRRIAPMHPRFAGDSTVPVPEDFDHSGPWPRMPNWIQANWDLTGDVAATELRARLLAGARFAKPALRAAA